MMTQIDPTSLIIQIHSHIYATYEFASFSSRQTAGTCPDGKCVVSVVRKIASSRMTHWIFQSEKGEGIGRHLVPLSIVAREVARKLSRQGKHSTAVYLRRGIPSRISDERKYHGCVSVVVFMRECSYVFYTYVDSPIATWICTILRGRLRKII